MARSNWITSARNTLALESAGLKQLEANLAGDLGERLADAVQLISALAGRVIVSGMGKSGHVGRKIAATLASTGTPSLFVHPAEASHGDLGMITAADAVLMLSNSGESAELSSILAYCKRFTVPLIAMTARPASALGREADVVLLLPDMKEACPNGLAPTTSTLMQLALGDALAIALLEMNGFTARDFQAFHPGGKLGAQLQHAREIMHAGDRLPLVTRGTGMGQALIVMSEKSFGCVGVVGGDGTLAGIVTDGDLRRHMGPGLMHQNVESVMSERPRTVTGDMLAGEVLQMMNAARITSVFVVDDNKPLGLIHIHDLLRAGVV